MLLCFFYRQVFFPQTCCYENYRYLFFSLRKNLSLYFCNTSSNMAYRLARFLFFANYFVGFLAIALAVETCYLLGLPLNQPIFYTAVFLATVLYYTRAYQTPANIKYSENPRTLWYIKHRKFVAISQWAILSALIIALLLLCNQYFAQLTEIPWYYWPFVLSLPVAGLLYYGLVPKGFLSLNLRNTGWFKPFVIGYVWAVFIGILPVCMSLLEHPGEHVHSGLMLWLFIKNWMFCTVNAIMFDIKDYADDSNHQLKTFVVRIGLKKTIFYVLIPLMLIGAIAVMAALIHRHFSVGATSLHLLPFLCMLLVAYSLQRKKAILYYLIVIDGLLLLKALCGIASVTLFD